MKNEVPEKDVKNAVEWGGKKAYFHVGKKKKAKKKKG